MSVVINHIGEIEICEHVAVGIRVASDPPHRSLRADLPHRAPTLSGDTNLLP